jgi:hypothetical protein
MAIRYKVVSFGGHDGLKFQDLLIKYSTGYLLPLKVKQGDYIPLDILDPMDVKKSLIVGDLGRHLKSGNIVAEDDSIKPVVVEVPKVVAPVIVHAVQSPPALTPTVGLPVPEPQNLPVPGVPAPSLVELQKAQENNNMDLGSVKTAADFNKLRYFLKLRFIKECNDGPLLQQIFNQLDPKDTQFRNNLLHKLGK